MVETLNLMNFLIFLSKTPPALKKINYYKGSTGVLIMNRSLNAVYRTQKITLCGFEGLLELKEHLQKTQEHPVTVHIRNILRNTSDIGVRTKLVPKLQLRVDACLPYKKFGVDPHIDKSLRIPIDYFLSTPTALLESLKNTIHHIPVVVLMGSASAAPMLINFGHWDSYEHYSGLPWLIDIEGGELTIGRTINGCYPEKRTLG